MTNDEFNQLFSMKKQILRPNPLKLPKQGHTLVCDVESETSSDIFELDLSSNAKIELKIKSQLRYGKTFPMVRLEINARPHRNPNGILTSRNHIHIYKENYGMSWAYALPEIFDDEKNQSELIFIFTKFCFYCNIVINSDLQGVI